MRRAGRLGGEGTPLADRLTPRLSAHSYLQYLELLNLPADLRVVLDQYLEAANKGRSSQKTCEEIYSGCEFSVKSLINKYNGSNSI